MATDDTEQTRSLQKDGEPYKQDTTEIDCPGCGVVQKRTVMAQQYQNAPTAYYVDEECPVCGFEGVWL